MKHDKDTQPITVTVRPDGTYYVEKAKGAVAAAGPQVRPVMQAGQLVRPGMRAAPSPVAVSVTTALRDLAGIAVAARAAAPALGKYGVVAAIGLGVLNAWASAQPPRPAAVRFQLRRIRRSK